MKKLSLRGVMFKEHWDEAISCQNLKLCVMRLFRKRHRKRASLLSEARNDYLYSMVIHPPFYWQPPSPLIPYPTGAHVPSREGKLPHQHNLASIG